MWERIKRLKNTTDTLLQHNVSGIAFPPGVYVDITPDFLYFYRNNYDAGQMWGWFDNGDLIFNDGVQDYTEKYQAFHRFVEGAFGIPFLDNSMRSNAMSSATIQEAIEEARPDIEDDDVLVKEDINIISFDDNLDVETEGDYKAKVRVNHTGVTNNILTHDRNNCGYIIRLFSSLIENNHVEADPLIIVDNNGDVVTGGE